MGREGSGVTLDFSLSLFLSLASTEECMTKLTGDSDFYLGIRLRHQIMIWRVVSATSLSQPFRRDHLIVLIGAFTRLLPPIFVRRLDVGLARVPSSYLFRTRVLPPHPLGSVSGCSAQSEARRTPNTHETSQSIEITRETHFRRRKQRGREGAKGRKKKRAIFFSYPLYIENVNEDERGDGVPANSCSCLKSKISRVSAPVARVRVCVSIDARRNHEHTHTRVHTFRTGYTYTRTHDTATNYYYSTITTATITTIIGCLSIRLTPSSGPNYYVTIFIDNKGRNKY